MALTALLLAIGAASCGDAQSAQDEDSVRMIPPAEAPVETAAGPADGAGGASSGDGMVAAPGGASEEPAGAMGDEDPAAPSAAPEDAASTRPRAVRRSEPEPGADAATASPRSPGTPARDGSETPVRRAPREGELERTDPGRVSRPEGFELSDEPTPAPPTVPAGTRLDLLMETGLSTDESREGDRFRARLEDDVLGADGMVLLPRDALVRGRVTESRESEASDRPAVLTLLVESVEVDGVSHPLRGTVEEVEIDADVRDGGRETATKVGVGAAAGAVLGKILGGDSKDALKGAAVGAAAGAAVALATRSGHATVPEGARLVVRLDEPLVLAGSGAR